MGNIGPVARQSRVGVFLHIKDFEYYVMTRPQGLKLSKLKNFTLQNQIKTFQDNIARDLNSTAISQYATLKMTDVSSKHVW